MRYKIEFSRNATKILNKLEAKLALKILRSIRKLTENPRPLFCKKLEDSKNEYRIRIGDYRVIYEIFDNKLLVYVIKISHRKDAYRK